MAINGKTKEVLHCDDSHDSSTPPSSQERSKVIPNSGFLGTHSAFPGLRRKSTGQADNPLPTLRTLYGHFDGSTESHSSSTVGQSSSKDGHYQPRLRSLSNADFLNTKDTWATELLAQVPVREAFKFLEKEFTAFKESAGDEAWQEFLTKQQDVVTSLDKITVKAAEKSGSRKKRLRARRKFAKYFDALGPTILEFAKLLDPLMNIAPDAVVAIWGAMKVCLAIQINDANIRLGIKNALIDIGNQLVVVNQILLCFPQENVLSDVAALYEKFATFLGKALHCQSLRHRGHRAIRNYWNTKLKILVDDISLQFTRIERLAYSSHFLLSHHSNQMLCQILKGQHRDRQAQAHGVAVDLTPFQDEIVDEFKGDVLTEMRMEMKKTVKNLFTDFDREWPGRFEQIMEQHVKENSPLSPKSQIWADWNSSGTGSDHTRPSDSPTHFAHLLRSKATFEGFRDEVFPCVKHQQSTESILQLKNRRLRDVEYQYITSVLKQPLVKSWIKDPHTGLLFLESRMDSRLTDWMSALVIDLVQQASQNSLNTVLRFFCQTAIIGQDRATSVVALQSLVSQALDQILKLQTPHTALYKQRFVDAKDSVEGLADLLHDILIAGETTRVWLIIDRIGMLKEACEPTDDLFILIKCLSKLAMVKEGVIKVIITSRVGGRKWALEAAQRTVLADHHLVVRASIQRGGKIRAQSAEVLRNTVRNMATKHGPDRPCPRTDRKSQDMLVSDSDRSSLCCLSDESTHSPRRRKSSIKMTKLSDEDSDFPQRDALQSDASTDAAASVASEDGDCESSDSSNDLLQMKSSPVKQNIRFADHIDWRGVNGNRYQSMGSNGASKLKNRSPPEEPPNTGSQRRKSNSATLEVPEDLHQSGTRACKPMCERVEKNRRDMQAFFESEEDSD